MGRNVGLDDIFFGDDDVDAALVKWREAIEAAHNWDVKGSCNFIASEKGYTLHIKGAGAVRIAKTGGSAIGAMSGSTPGSGLVTPYEFDGSTLVTSGVTTTAFNLHPTATVSANAWIMYIEVQGFPFVFWEPC